MSTSKQTFPDSSYLSNLTKVLFSAEDISGAVARLGAQISKDYLGKDLVVVALLRGAFIFQADLVRHISVPHEIDFMMLGSYVGTHSHNVKISLDMKIDPYKKHILIVEDLIDTGATLAWLQQHLKTKKSLSVRLCTLINKKTPKRVKDVKVDYIGFECPDYWIVGYGMDYNQHYRSLPCIGVLDPQIYQGKKKDKKDTKDNEEKSEDAK
eukprot:UN10555